MVLRSSRQKEPDHAVLDPETPAMQKPGQLSWRAGIFLMMRTAPALPCGLRGERNGAPRSASTHAPAEPRFEETRPAHSGGVGGLHRVGHHKRGAASHAGDWRAALGAGVDAACVALGTLPSSVSAEAQNGAAAETLLRGCLGVAEPDDSDRCMDAYSRQCAKDLPGVGGTVTLSACAAAETKGWDRLLNENHADLVVLSKRRAAGKDEAIVSPPLEVMLRDAQRAWNAFRDADCRHEHAIWGEGSQRQLAGAVCLLERTARRTLEFRRKLEQMQAEWMKALALG